MLNLKTSWILAGALVGCSTTPKEWNLESRMRHHHVPGVSIAVVENGEIVSVESYGVREAGRPETVTSHPPALGGF